MSKLVLIDGHSILTRAFFGVPDLTTGTGLHTNAVYGFLNIMFKILEEEKPEYLMVAFDVKAPTFRHEIYKEYKGTRKPMPGELHQQVPVIKNVLTAMNIRIIEKEGYEADDILGTVGKDAVKKGYEVVIVSGDRDLLQLAEEHILIRIPKTKHGATEIENYYARDVEEAYHVTPLEFIDLKALMGDTSDNIPGVKSIGEKTASKLISMYHTVENLYEHIDEVTPERVKNALIADKDNAFLSKTLAAININSPVDVFVEDGLLGDMYNEKSYKLISELEFKSMLKRFSEDFFEEKKDIDFEKLITEVKDEESLDELIKTLSAICDLEGADEYIGVYYRYFEQLNIHGLTIGADKKLYYIENNESIDKDKIRELLELIAASGKMAVFNLKELLHDAKELKVKALSIENDRDIWDLAICSYLLNPLKDTYTYSDVARDIMGITLKGKDELIGKMSDFEMYSLDRHKYIMYTCNEAYVCSMGAGALYKKLKAANMYELYRDIEYPVIYVLYEMEKNGILVDANDLKEYSGILNDIIIKTEKEIYKEIGQEFNINSPKQLGEILFGKMGLPGGKKTKTGYSTSAEVLEKLAPDYPVINRILEYRQLTKLKSTYADGLVGFIGYDDRIHGKFNQTITATGRISSTEPNLQNIPIRMEMGKRFRKVFIPMKDFTFLDADYSQIELRILAHMSGDENLIAAYNSEQDIHKITASQVFKLPLSEVTPQIRSRAKAVNFGIVYGISSFGLSQDLNIGRKEASEYINQYFETYPQVKSFLDETVEGAKEKGYVTTLFGRRRPIPELKSSNFMQRSFGERAAMNSAIQGTAADIMKLAMIAVYREFRKRKLKSRLILQVHDEILIEAAPEELSIVKDIVKTAMMNAAKLKVTLEIDMKTGDNWLEAH